MKSHCHWRRQHEAEINQFKAQLEFLTAATSPTQRLCMPTYALNLHFPHFLFASIVSIGTSLALQTHHSPLPPISMAAERTCRSIWLIIFTLPAEAGLSWGCLHLSLSLSPPLFSSLRRLAPSTRSPSPPPQYTCREGEHTHCR